MCIRDSTLGFAASGFGASSESPAVVESVSPPGAPAACGVTGERAILSGCGAALGLGAASASGGGASGGAIGSMSICGPRRAGARSICAGAGAGSGPATVAPPAGLKIKNRTPDPTPRTLRQPSRPQNQPGNSLLRITTRAVLWRGFADASADAPADDCPPD